MIEVKKITHLGKYLSLCLIGLLAIATLSCKEEEELSCPEIEFQLDEVERNMFEAVASENCELVTALFKRSFSLIRQGRNCEYLQAILADEGYANVEAYIDYLEGERDRILDAIGCLD